MTPFQCSSLPPKAKRAPELGKHRHLKMGHLKGTHETFLCFKRNADFEKNALIHLFMTERNL